jgi:hypothetical protein
VDTSLGRPRSANGKRVTVVCESRGVGFQAFHQLYNVFKQLDVRAWESIFSGEGGEDKVWCLTFIVSLSVRIFTHPLDLEGDLEEVFLLHAARIYRPCEATDPRDKIYALLGLLGGRRQEDILAFTPNYNISVQELYKEFTRYFINKGDVHSILALCNGSY